MIREIQDAMLHALDPIPKPLLMQGIVHASR